MAFSSASLFSVAEVTKHQSFVVPEFQRGYAWGRDQWQALWDDVEHVSRRDQSQHYGGSIMISATGAEARMVELVDGQQRMTSISLMLAALGAPGFAITFRDNEALQTYFDFYALGHKHLGSSLNTRRSYYARNIALASEYFSERADQLTPEARLRLVDVLLHKVKLFVLAIRPEFNIHVAFETINNRGRPLSTLERLKNRLIYLASYDDDPDAASGTVREIHRSWKQVYAWLGAGKTLLDDDEFLRAHSMGWFRHEKKSEWLASKLFDEMFSANGGTALREIETYVRSLERAAACWHLLNEPDAFPPHLSRSLVSLQKTPSATSRPLLLWALMRLADGHPRLIEKPEQDSGWGESLAALARQAERFGVLVVLANARAANIGLNDMNRSAHALAHPGTPIYENYPKLVVPSQAKKAVDFARSHLAYLVYNGEPSRDDEDEDETFLNSQFPWRGFFSPMSVQNVVADRMRKGPGFYNWQFGKLVIYAWEDFLRGDAGRPPKKPWEKFAWDDSVEHIYPQTPHRAWQESISLDGRSAKVARNAVTNSLGNLLLLSRSRNASASNEPYSVFEAVKGKRARYVIGSYSEAQVARVCPKWTVLQIAARGIAMFRHAQIVWDFEAVSRDQKLTDWFPVLFGDQASRVQQGDFSHGRPLSNSQLRPWVEKFECET